MGSVLRGLGVFVTARAVSGLPYTRLENTGQGQTAPFVRFGLTAQKVEPLNASTMPWTKYLDVRLNKGIRLGKLDWTLFADVRNLFNFKNVVQLFAETGDVVSTANREKQLDAETSTLVSEATANNCVSDVGSRGHPERDGRRQYVLGLGGRRWPGELRHAATHRGALGQRRRDFLRRRADERAERLVRLVQRRTAVLRRAVSVRVIPLSARSRVSSGRRGDLYSRNDYALSSFTRAVASVPALALGVLSLLAAPAAAKPSDSVRRRALNLFAVTNAILEVNSVFCAIYNIGELCANRRTRCSAAVSGPKARPTVHLQLRPAAGRGHSEQPASPGARPIPWARSSSTPAAPAGGRSHHAVYNSARRAGCRGVAQRRRRPRSGAVSPVLLGQDNVSQQDLWIRAWDGNPAFLSGRTHPMGILVEERGLAWNYPTGNEDIIYFLLPSQRHGAQRGGVQQPHHRSRGPDRDRGDRRRFPEPQRGSVQPRHSGRRLRDPRSFAAFFDGLGRGR